jgi:DNA-directed RNA polymerase specialized sigma24 family protein
VADLTPPSQGSEPDLGPPSEPPPAPASNPEVAPDSRPGTGPAKASIDLVALPNWPDISRDLDLCCLRRTGNIATAGDLAQETIKRIYEGRRHFDPKGKFTLEKWVLAVANSIWLNEVTSARARHEELDATGGGIEDNPSVILDPEAVYLGRERQKLARARLNRMTELATGKDNFVVRLLLEANARGGDAMEAALAAGITEEEVYNARKVLGRLAAQVVMELPEDTRVDEDEE